MWALKIILLLLPAIAYCGISIKINVGRTEAETSISFSGSDEAPISAIEQETFRIDSKSLKISMPVEKNGLDACPKSDAEHVKRILKPVGYKIIGIQSKTDAVATVEYENFQHKIEAQYSTTIEKSVQEQISHGWSTSEELSESQEIYYSIGSVGGYASMFYTAVWGKDKSESRTVSLGMSSTVQVTVPPGGKVIATLSASSTTLEVEIYYEASLTGYVFCENNKPSPRFSRLQAYGIDLLRTNIYIPTQVKSTEHLSISFYSNAKLKMTDGSESPAVVKV